MNNWNSENIKLFEQIIDRAERGFYLDGKTLTDLYNSVLNLNIRPTGCATCIRNRYKTLKTSYDEFIKELKKQEEETEKFVEVLDEVMEVETPKKKGRPKKTDGNNV